LWRVAIEKVAENKEAAGAVAVEGAWKEQEEGIVHHVWQTKSKFCGKNVVRGLSSRLSAPTE